MRKTSKVFFGFIKGHKIWSTIIGLFIIGIAWYLYKNSSENINYNEVAVTRGSISEIVSVTGNVKPLSEVNLAFELGGRVANINVSVGDKVYLGQNLASVSNADLVASLAQAQANLKKVAAGFGDGALKATLDLAQAKSVLINSIKDSYTKGDDAIRNKMYTLFTNPAKYRARLAFTTDTFLADDLEEGKDHINDTLDFWSRSLVKLNNSSNLETYYAEAKLNLDLIKNLLDKCAEAVNGLGVEAGYTTQTQIDTWKANISTARTNINTAVDTLVASFDQYKTLSLAVSISKNTTLGEEASIEQAQAGVASAEANLAKSIIHSPIVGVITNIDAKLGEIISSGKNVLSVISYGDYEVESFIPEADISKVKIGNSALTTLDAYGDSVTFNTSVVKVDPAATVIDGVPTYKVTLKFDAKDERVRSGMTANLDILTNKKEGVLILPSRVIVSRDDGKYVSVLNPNDRSEIQDKKIEIGLRGSDGNTEILSGLSEGDKVVTSL